MAFRVSIVAFRVSIVVFRVSFVAFYRVSFVATPCFNRDQAVVKGLTIIFQHLPTTLAMSKTVLETLSNKQLSTLLVANVIVLVAFFIAGGRGMLFILT